MTSIGLKLFPPLLLSRGVDVDNSIIPPFKMFEAASCVLAVYGKIKKVFFTEKQEVDT
jgi:hypothetical protein